MQWLLKPFSFRGPLTRFPYAISAGAVIGGQYLFAFVAAAVLGRTLVLDWTFWLVPLRALATLPEAPAGLMAFAMAATLVLDALLAALSFRRAEDAGASSITTIFVVMPIIQLFAVLGLIAPPSQHPAGPTEAEAGPPSEKSVLKTAAQGAFLGGGLCAVATALSTLGFGAYGYALFIVTPFTIGGVAGYVANREREISGAATVGIVLVALIVAGVTLLALALEGAVCIVMAAPLIVPMAIVGGLLGRAQAANGRPSTQASVFSLAILPALFAFERAFTAEASFTSTEAIVIAAPPAAVWRALIDPRPISERTSLPYRLGLAYPVSGKLLGTGVGALRRGVFSTGVAMERITVWRPSQALSFAVLNDPPMMRELSPSAHVGAPHLLGYFHTASANFTITPLPDGTTRLAVSAPHTMRIEPALYWLPIARRTAAEDERRALRHFKCLAEGRAG